MEPAHPLEQIRGRRPPAQRVRDRAFRLRHSPILQGGRRTRAGEKGVGGFQAVPELGMAIQDMLEEPECRDLGLQNQGQVDPDNQELPSSRDTEF